MSSFLISNSLLVSSTVVFLNIAASRACLLKLWMLEAVVSSSRALLRTHSLSWWHLLSWLWRMGFSSRRRFIRHHAQSFCERTTLFLRSISWIRWFLPWWTSFCERLLEALLNHELRKTLLLFRTSYCHVEASILLKNDLILVLNVAVALLEFCSFRYKRSLHCFWLLNHIILFLFGREE